MDQGVQHKVQEGKLAYKRAEQRHRNELSTLRAELEHCLPPKFLNWMSAKKPEAGIYEKWNIKKAMLNYHKHQAAVIEEQLETFKAQAAAKAALEESNVALMQQIQQSGT